MRAAVAAGQAQTVAAGRVARAALVAVARVAVAQMSALLARQIPAAAVVAADTMLPTALVAMVGLEL
jgi:hypothetical protein